MVVRMSDNSVDPSGNTEAFRAFTQNTTPEPPTTGTKTPLIIGGVVAVVAIIAIVAWLAF